MKRASNGPQLCRDCGAPVMWATTAGKKLKVLLDLDCTDDGVYRVDTYRVGESLAQWVHEPYRPDLRKRVGLRREHECPAQGRIRRAS